MTDGFTYIVVQVKPRIEINGFNTAVEVAEFLWGQYLPRYAIFKNGEWVRPESGEYNEFERELEVA